MDELAIRERLLLSLHRDGYPFVVVGVVATVVLGLIDSIFWLPGIISSALLYFFFRVPNSTAPDVENALLSPATGTVLVAEASSRDSGEEGASKSREPFVVRISVTLLDSGVLRFPLAGQVLRRQDKPGSPSGLDFRKARENAAQTELSLRGGNNDSEYELKVRAGVLGRSLVLDLPSGGEEISTASAFGFTRFGGMVDITFDASEYRSLVSIGQRVIAGESIIAQESNKVSKKASTG